MFFHSNGLKYWYFYNIYYAKVGPGFIMTVSSFISGNGQWEAISSQWGQAVGVASGSGQWEWPVGVASGSKQY